MPSDFKCVTILVGSCQPGKLQTNGAEVAVHAPRDSGSSASQSLPANLDASSIALMPPESRRQPIFNVDPPEVLL
jgi:hypothetical protein